MFKFQQSHLKLEMVTFLWVTSGKPLFSSEGASSFYPHKKYPLPERPGSTTWILQEEKHHIFTDFYQMTLFIRFIISYFFFLLLTF